MTEKRVERTRGHDESDARLRLLEATNVVPWEADARTWQFTYVGPQVQSLLGYPPERWYEADFWPKHVHPDDRDYALAFCETSSRTLNNYEFDYRMIAADGRSVWVHDVVNVVRKQGQPTLLRGFLQDISDRKRLEEELRRAREHLDDVVKVRTTELQELVQRYAALIDAIPDLVVRMDTSGRCVDLHVGDQATLDGRPDDDAGRKVGELVAPKFLEAAGQRVREVVEHGEMQVCEYQVGSNGDARQFEARIVPSGGGEAVAFIRDVTETRKIQERLSLSEFRLKEAHRIARVGNWEWDDETEELWWSEETYRLFEQDPTAPLTFDSFIDRVHPEDRERVIREVSIAHEKRRPYGFRFRVVLPGGAVRFMESRAQIAAHHPGRATRWVGVVHDITDLMSLNAKLAEQNAELATRDRNKDLFLTSLGHELRNPLGAIRNSLDLISLLPAGAAGESERSLALEVIQRQCNQSLRLLDDLLDLERVKHGKFELRLESVDLAQIANETFESLKGRVEPSRLEFRLITPARPVYVRADRARLQQIFQNLLDNALRFTEAGEIAIIIRAVGTDAEVVVRDTGAGIDAGEVDAVFEPYYQGRRMKDGAANLGFGLALVKGVVEKHGGTIDVHSDGPGTGTAFTFTLPLAERECDEPRSIAPVMKPRGHRILVVDDQRDNAEMLGAMLRTLGQETEVAYDGPGALQVAAEQRPEIAFLDLSMPGMDGREVARRLRAKFTPAELVLVAVTGLAQKGGTEEHQDPDFAHYLVKPAGLEDVVRLLNSV